MGTIVNALAILAGAIIGMLVKNKVNEKLHTTVMQALGLGVLFVGLSSAIKNLLNPSANPILFILSLAIGAFAGELLAIDKKLDSMGLFLENKVTKKSTQKDSEKSTGIAEGFVTATLLFCVGTMAIIGSIESGAYNDHTTLYAKSLIDGITAILLASTLGFGVTFSALSVLAYQGLLTFVATLIAPYLTADMLLEIGIVGGILIAALGLNMLKITKIKVSNLLPAILIPVIYSVIIKLV